MPARNLSPYIQRKSSLFIMGSFFSAFLIFKPVQLVGTFLLRFVFTGDADGVFLLTVLLTGAKGAAYNIADERSDIHLKDLAALIAGAVDRKVIFDIPSQIESAGFSKATKARLDSKKLQSLGWKAQYDIKDGITRTIRILRECGSQS